MVLFSSGGHSSYVAGCLSCDPGESLEQNQPWQIFVVPVCTRALLPAHPRPWGSGETSYPGKGSDQRKKDMFVMLPECRVIWNFHAGYLALSWGQCGALPIS